MDPRAIVAAQLGRTPRGWAGVALTCPFGFPAVVETLPYLEDGAPFPTLLYLTCPSAVSEIGGQEARQGVGELRRLVRDEPAVRHALHDLTERYQRRRRALVSGGRPPSGASDGGAVLEMGIGGPPDPRDATCLHAYAAALLVALEGPPQILRGLPTAGEGAAHTQQSLPSPGVEVLGAWRALLARMGNLWCMNAWCRAYLAGSERRAAIDVGTNSVRLLVADCEPGTAPRALLRQAEVTQLGEGIAEHRRLDPAARRRTTAAVEAYVRQARSLGADHIVLVATSAAREAADGRDFVSELGHEFGIRAVVAPGSLEARLAYAGATLEMPECPVFIDPGGGSTELVHQGSDGELVAVSLDIGAVRATERWIRHDPVLPEERRRIREEAAAAFVAWRSHFARGAVGGDRRLVGVAGTVTTIACQVLGLSEYDSDRVHLTRITRSDVQEQADRLAALTNEERSCLSCMQKGRERVIVAGADILSAALEVFDYDELLVSERDILDGIVMAAPELAEAAERDR
jgi:exopolyphosphatase / guanosine-5'-triphosphate,3'-diphosphate pyrophosphatase